MFTMPVGLWSGGEAGPASFNLAAASYDTLFDVSAQSANAYGIAFMDDGAVMLVGDRNSATLYQYALSTPYDIATASYAGKSFYVGGQDGFRGLSVNPDGTRLLMNGSNNDIYSYTLATAHDVSSAVYDGYYLDVSPQLSAASAFYVDATGSHLYVADGGSKRIYQYAVSSPFDVRTASYGGLWLDYNAAVGSPIFGVGPTGVVLSASGKKMLVCDEVTVSSQPSVYQFTLATAFDISTASYDGVSLDADSQSTLMAGVCVSADERMMYLAGRTGDAIYAYAV